MFVKIFPDKSLLLGWKMCPGASHLEWKRIKFQDKYMKEKGKGGKKGEAWASQICIKLRSLNRGKKMEEKKTMYELV